MIFYIFKKYQRMTLTLTVLTFFTFISASVSAVIYHCSCAEKKEKKISCCCEKEENESESECCKKQSECETDKMKHDCNSCSIENAPLEVPIQTEKSSSLITQVNDIFMQYNKYPDASNQFLFKSEREFPEFNLKIFLTNSVLRI